MKSKFYLALSGIILGALILAFILFSSNQPQGAGYLELYDVKEERVGIIHCKAWYLRWHGRKTELDFLFYKRSRVAGYGVPGRISGQWNQTNGNVLSVKDGNVCAAKNGDVFTLWIPISFAHVEITYDNKTVIIPTIGGELGEIR